MAKLTPKQEAFVRFYIETGNASEAYRRAYRTGKMKPATINRNAHALLENNKVATRVAELHSKAAEKAVLDKAWVLDRLMRNARICLGEETMKLKMRKPRSDEVTEIEAHLPDAAGANRALELLGKELTMFKERSEHVHEDGPRRSARDDERHARIVELLAKLGTSRTAGVVGNGAAHKSEAELPGFRRLH